MQAPEEQADVPRLLEQVRGGDQAAATRLVEHLYPHVIRIVRNHLPRGTQEEDLAQEIFIKMFTRLEQYKKEVPLEHWVSRIALNVCRDSLRSKQRRPELRWADLSEDQVDWIQNSPSGEANLTPDGQVAARDLMDRLMESLSAEDQVVMRLSGIEGKSIEEISQLTGWNRSLIKIRVFRARGKLRKTWEKLQKEGMEK